MTSNDAPSSRRCLGTTAGGRPCRACESLVRVRKLARTTPALQLNIAAHGGQQVNVVTDQSESDS